MGGLDECVLSMIYDWMVTASLYSGIAASMDRMRCRFCIGSGRLGIVLVTRLGKSFPSTFRDW